MTVYEDIQSMGGFLSPSTFIDIHSRERRGNSFEENKCDASSSRPTAFEDATGIRSKLHAIGRLDADTTGLLLLTNDGGLVHHVTNPEAKDNPSDGMQSTKNIMKKTYQALIMGHHTESSLLPIRNGVDIGKGYVTKQLVDEDDLQVLEHPNHKSTIISITIGEGKNRQVRKMFHAIGSGVMKLKRTRIGEHLTLNGVKGTLTCLM
jgi:23S rRNA pseudouridine2605 synthase